MSIVSIPKELTKGDELVIIPRKVYERVIRLLSKSSQPHKKKLDPGFNQALNEVKQNKLIGPFSSLAAGLKILKQVK